MSEHVNLIPGLSLLDHPTEVAMLQVNGYACLAKWDWEKERGADNARAIASSNRW